MNLLIAHGLVKVDGKYLLMKRTEIKQGKPNFMPLYWDIPGGHVEDGELPKDAVVRECEEEAGLLVKVGNILHEDSVYDKEKDIVYTRLVYECELADGQNEDSINLQLDEHSEYKLINNLDELDKLKVVDYIVDCINYYEKLNK